MEKFLQQIARTERNVKGNNKFWRKPSFNRLFLFAFIIHSEQETARQIDREYPRYFRLAFFQHFLCVMCIFWYSATFLVASSRFGLVYSFLWLFRSIHSFCGAVCCHTKFQYVVAFASKGITTLFIEDGMCACAYLSLTVELCSLARCFSVQLFTSIVSRFLAAFPLCYHQNVNSHNQRYCLLLLLLFLFGVVCARILCKRPSFCVYKKVYLIVFCLSFGGEKAFLAHSHVLLCESEQCQARMESVSLSTLSLFRFCVYIQTERVFIFSLIRRFYIHIQHP